MAGYSLTIGLNVLNHLGVNLYNSVPAVLSEAVANAWDADAQNVSIDIGVDSITITDDGHGMTRDDCSKKFLTIGYARRKDGGMTPGGRAVIGRKGIGKLSLFSIADVVEIHTARNGNPADRAGFIMDINKIRDEIERGNSSTTTCELEEVDGSKIEIESGTRIRLTGLNRRIGRDAKAVRKNLARRFSIIDPAHSFNVTVNGDAITINDRDYWPKLEYIWYMGGEGDRITRQCRRKRTEIDGTVDSDKEYRVGGWVGTVRRQEDMGNGNNRITVMARGKVIHEDILSSIKEEGVFSKYIIGEIQADFLDIDGEEDIATSGRQSVIEDSERFVALKEYVRSAVIRQVQSEWTRFRTESAKDGALSDPAVKEWFERLSAGNKKYAERLFQRIETFKGLDTDSKIELYRAAIVAFETLTMYEQLSALDRVHESHGLDEFLRVLGDVDKLEAVHYLNITRCRLEVLKNFQGLVDEDAKERVLQEYLFDHLWLLDPSWDRAGEDEDMEKSFRTACGAADADLTRDEENARVDIRYRTYAGMHVIVELKRRSARVDIHSLTRQIQKYNDAMEKILEARQDPSPQISIVCVLGSEPGPSVNPRKKQEQLKIYNGRYVTYESLIHGAQQAYADYVKKWEGVKNIKDLVERIKFDPPRPDPAEGR